MGNVFSDSCAAKVAPAPTQAPTANPITPATNIKINKPPANTSVTNSSNKAVEQTGGKRRKSKKSRSSKKVSKK